MGSQRLWFCDAMEKVLWGLFCDLVARIMREHQIEESFVRDNVGSMASAFRDMAISAESVDDAVKVWKACQVFGGAERVEDFPRERLDSLRWHIARYSKGPTPVPEYFRTEHEACLELCKEFIASSTRSLPSDVVEVVAKTYMENQLSDQHVRRRDVVFSAFARYGDIPPAAAARKMEIWAALQEMLPVTGHRGEEMWSMYPYIVISPPAHSGLYTRAFWSVHPCM